MGTIPTPGTQTASAVVSSTLLNGFRDVMAFWSNPPACQAYQSTAQSIPNNTYTAVKLNSELYDNVQAGDTPMHDLVTNNTRITVRTAGMYLIAGSVGFATNTTGVRKVQLYKNAATGLGEATAPPVSGVTTAIPVGPVIVPLAVGDYVEIRAFQTSGGALNTDASSGVTTLTLRLIGQ